MNELILSSLIIEWLLAGTDGLLGDGPLYREAKTTPQPTPYLNKFIPIEMKVGGPVRNY